MDSGLERFVNAQETAYPKALAEIRQGRKQGHWMWYIFPQIAGLGHSSTAQYYAIRDRQEAEDYLHHPLLGPRLTEITSELLLLEETDPQKIFGHTDSLKLRSCMTLFYMVSSDPLFRKVLDRFYGSRLDVRTLELM